MFAIEHLDVPSDKKRGEMGEPTSGDLLLHD